MQVKNQEKYEILIKEIAGGFQIMLNFRLQNCQADFPKKFNLSTTAYPGPQLHEIYYNPGFQIDWVNPSKRGGMDGVF